MQKLLIVGLGGMLGTMLRYTCNVVINHVMHFPYFPYATLFVNLLGCLCAGLFAGLIETKNQLTPEMRLFIQIGLLGGFTTFSSFGLETFLLLLDSHLLFAVINVVVQVTLGIIAVWLGYHAVA